MVIPCLNEVRTVGRCVAAALDGIRSTGLSGEVIVADNGSTDGSRELAEAEGARVVPVPRRGYGEALQAGFLAARGRLLVMGDADLSYDFRELPKLVEEQRRSEADIVLGDRLGGRIEPGAMPWTHHRIGNPLISMTIRRLFHVQLRDCYCGLRLLTREAHERLRLNASSMEYALQMIVQGALLGLHFSQVPITLHVDGRDHAPHLRTVRDGYRSFRFLFQHASITVYGLIGGMAAAAGLALIGRAAWVEAQGASPAAITAAAGGALLLFGWLLAVLGVIARVFVTGFLGGHADPSLRRLFRAAHLETAVAASAAMLLAGIALCIAFRRWPAILQLGITLSTMGIGTFVGAFVVSLIGRAIPTQQFGDIPTRPASGPYVRQERNTITQGDRSVAVQEKMAGARRYHRWQAETLREVWADAEAILDFGCGTGNVTEAIVEEVSPRGGRVVGFEMNEEAGHRFAERFAGRDEVRMVGGDAAGTSPELDGMMPFDAAVSVGLLAHVADDEAALRAIAARLKPGGRLGLVVPGGGDRLSSPLDDSAGLLRRYTAPRLRRRLEDAGFDVQSVRRINMVGGLLWFLKGRVLRSRGISDRDVEFLDRALTTVRRVDAIFGPPFGLSLAAIARLPESGSPSR
ncbi:MAG: glycosyltransferase [Candidatus Dormibacteraeota bacterium]|nr:glycosyltransferase [Candidatus Dormibacteraeota bacterium]